MCHVCTNEASAASRGKDRAQGQACAVQNSGRATFYRVATVPGRGREEGQPKLPTTTGPLNFRSLFPRRGAPGIPEDTHRARNRAGVGETDLFHRSRRMTSHRRSRKTRRQQNKASRQNSATQSGPGSAEFCGKGTRSRQAGRPAAAPTGARPASLPPGTGSKVVQPFHRPRETKLPYPMGRIQRKGCGPDHRSRSVPPNTLGLRWAIPRAHSLELDATSRTYRSRASPVCLCWPVGGLGGYQVNLSIRSVPGRAVRMLPIPRLAGHKGLFLAPALLVSQMVPLATGLLTST